MMGGKSNVIKLRDENQTCQVYHLNILGHF